jgi:uroporphyrinogen-III decarboxylase
VAGIILPGIFEMVHNLMGMEHALMAFCEKPDEMHELIDYIADFEIRYAEVLIDKIHPDCIFHHDDWGSQKSSFMSPTMFKTFFVAPYKRIYDFYKGNGVELIVHHSDSYAANLVPHMIEMGIDIWQGVMTTNNTPALIEKYGEQISFMGNIDTGIVDLPDWTPKIALREAEKACTECGKLHFIPCLTRGMSASSFPGAYDEVSLAINQMSKSMF